MHEPPLPKPGDEFYQYNNRMNNYLAFQSRTKLVHMTNGHRNADKFPYNEYELAVYMLEYISTQLGSALFSTNGDGLNLSNSDESLEN